MTQEELIVKAEKYGVYIPEGMRIVRTGNITGEELEQKKKALFLIDPIIREGTGILIYGGTGVAKTWLAMSIAIAIVNGKNVFTDRWRVINPDGIKCLIVAGEMNDWEYGERFKRLNQHYAIDGKHKKNFILQRADQLDLASPVGATRLNEIIDDANKRCGVPGQQVKLVILDNLTTLSVEGENPANFGRIEHALKSLKDRGIAVVMIHHENKQGQIRGAQKIGDVMDMILHLHKANQDDKVGIIVKNEKIRSDKQSEFATFKAVLDVDAIGTGWVVSEPTQEELATISKQDEDAQKDQVKPQNKVSKTKYGLTAWEWLSDEERENSVIAQRLKGVTNAQIAANHTTSRTTVCDFRKAHNIRDCDLKKNGINPVGQED